LIKVFVVVSVKFVKVSRGGILSTLS